MRSADRPIGSIQPPVNEGATLPVPSLKPQRPLTTEAIPPPDPLRTMLTLDELKRMDDITGSTLFSAELRRLSYIPRSEQQPFVDAARRGDKTSRDALVLNCLNWVLGRAVRIYLEREPEHIDVMDLVSVGNVELVEKLDKALTMQDPVGYLLSTAAFEMQSYCSNKNSMIQRPRQSNERLKKTDPIPATSTSLEKPFVEGSTRSYADVLPEKDCVLISDQTKEEKHDRRFHVLHEAINGLTPSRRHAIVQSYGFFGETAKTKEEIAEAANLTKNGIRDSLLRGKKDLAKKLKPHLSQLTRRQK